MLSSFGLLLVLAFSAPVVSMRVRARTGEWLTTHTTECAEAETHKVLEPVMHKFEQCQAAGGNQTSCMCTMFDEHALVLNQLVGRCPELAESLEPQISEMQQKHHQLGCSGGSGCTEADMHKVSEPFMHKIEQCQAAGGDYNSCACTYVEEFAAALEEFVGSCPQFAPVLDDLKRHMPVKCSGGTGCTEAETHKVLEPVMHKFEQCQAAGGNQTSCMCTYAEETRLVLNKFAGRCPELAEALEPKLLEMQQQHQQLGCSGGTLLNLVASCMQHGTAPPGFVLPPLGDGALRSWLQSCIENKLQAGAQWNHLVEGLLASAGHQWKQFVEGKLAPAIAELKQSVEDLVASCVQNGTAPQGFVLPPGTALSDSPLRDVLQSCIKKGTPTAEAPATTAAPGGPLQDEKESAEAPATTAAPGGPLQEEKESAEAPATTAAPGGPLQKEKDGVPSLKTRGWLFVIAVCFWQM